MRAFELYEFSHSQLGLKAVLPRGHDLTLRHLNKLKHIRKRRAEERAEKLSLVRRMYGSNDVDETALDIEKQKLELDMLKQDIQHAIDTAKLSDQSKAKVQDMAQDALGRSLKD